MILELALTLAAHSAGIQQPIQGSSASPRDSAVVASGDSVTLHLVDTDLRAAVQALAPYLDRPVVFGGLTATSRVTLTTPAPIARTQVVALLRGLLENQHFQLVSDSIAHIYTIAPEPPSPALSPPTAASVVPQQLSSGPIQLFVVHLRHARASDVAATVNALFGRVSALGEIGASPQATLSQSLTANQVAPAGSQSQLPEAVRGFGGRAATFEGDVTIVADPRSNSLLVRASPSDFELVKAAVSQLDTRPLQVLIEVVIAELRRNREFALGVDASMAPNRINGSQATIAGSQMGLGGAGDFVLQVMHLGSMDIQATLTAAENRGDVRILSKPAILAENNQPATLNVGSQRPFIQVSRSLPTDAATRDQIVEYKDVGTRLTVQPTISPDGYVVLSVTQEVNNATAEVAFNAPVISTRSVQTQLLIKDGQTVALGGLTDRQHDVNQGGVPILSAIPLIGGLFGHESRQSSETELYLFLTPHVIKTDEDVDSLTAPLRKQAKSQEP